MIEVNRILRQKRIIGIPEYIKDICLDCGGSKDGYNFVCKPCEMKDSTKWLKTKDRAGFGYMYYRRLEAFYGGNQGILDDMVSVCEMYD